MLKIFPDSNQKKFKKINKEIGEQVRWVCTKKKELLIAIISLNEGVPYFNLIQRKLRLCLVENDTKASSSETNIGVKNR